MTQARSDKSNILLAAMLVAPLFINACTTTKTGDGSGSSSDAADPASTSASSAASTNSSDELPAELRDAQHFDPVTTMDPKTIQESDFFQIKQSIEQNKNNLDQSWKEQDRIEALIKASDKADEEKKSAAAKAEEEERERQRQQAIKDFEKNKDQRAKDEEKANEDVKKLPTINRNEENWNGLEH